MNILPEAPLAGLNTLALAANAQALAVIDSDDTLLAALNWAEAEGLSVLPLGQGSNIVFAGDVEALVLCPKIAGIEVQDETSVATHFHVGAGENWHEFVQWTLQNGYAGLENLALIPGTVGAAPIQNIGAYGVELDAFVTAVHGRHCATGEPLVLGRAECGFAYRDSIFKHALRDQVVITAVDFQLPRGSAVNISYPALANALADDIEDAQGTVAPQQVFDAVVKLRRSKLPDPANEPNAGSFFKNPVVAAKLAQQLQARFPGLPSYPQPDGWTKLPAAWLIERCGWKGHRGESLGVHPEHALVLVNYGNGSGAELLALADDIARSVSEVFAVQLEIEPRIYGLPA